MNPTATTASREKSAAPDLLPEGAGPVPAPGQRQMINIMTIDLEEWFQVTNFEPVISRAEWDSCPSRIEGAVARLLDLFSEHRVRATFFVLGWIAERHPEMIRRIDREGHEIASHGYDHRLVTAMMPAEFRCQLVQSRDILEQLIGKAVLGYRAPSYSFREGTEWVIEELLDAHFSYDSSIFPFGVRRNPRLCDSRVPCRLVRGDRDLLEYPLSIVSWNGVDIPIAGGGYFRLLPYPIVRQGIRQLNRQGTPAVMFFHPWEFDPGQPRVAAASPLSKFRHYLNLGRNECKLKALVQEFRFASIKDVFWNEHEAQYGTVAQL